MNTPRYLILLAALHLASVATAQRAPILHWDFERSDGNLIYERITGKADSVSGHFSLVETGVTGKAYKPDGFTACLDVGSSSSVSLNGSFSLEAWLSQAAYPWNWAPLIANIQSGSQRQEGTRGFYFGVGPRGQLGLEVYIEGELYRCITDDFVLPLYEWHHVAAVYDGTDGIRLYVDGKEAGYTFTGRKYMAPADRSFRIGMNYDAVKPSHIHRQFGTLPYWYSIDGAIDDIRIFDAAVDVSDLDHDTGLAGKEVPFGKRELPAITDIERFGASYAKLAYYDEWDDLWPVAEHPDVVVNFDKSPVRLVFWRGLRYSPAWVSEKNFWMADQSVEAWNDTEGCYEHMQDRHCKYSHVRILENSPARVLVHWRYAPLSAYNTTWNVDEKTGWECWIDEYYYIYPDGSAIRHVEWKSGSLGFPRQFQESIPLAGPGQLQGDIIEKDWVTVANQAGDRQTYFYVTDPDPASTKAPSEPNIQKHNFRSRFDPFIIFETGNEMHYLGDRDISSLSKPGSCNHWPVGQAYCDGRTSQAADRPTSFLGFPISYPPIRNSDSRSWWNGIYGMTDRSADYLVRLSRSWNDPPEAKLLSEGWSSPEYDRSERAYMTRRLNGSAPLKVELDGTLGNPICNIAMVIEKPGGLKGKVKLNGRELPGSSYSTGIVQDLEGDKMVIWIWHDSESKTTIEIF